VFAVYLDNLKLAVNLRHLRQTTNSSHVFGHSVKIKVSPEHIQNLQQIRFADALEESEINSVISFDRLVRTVHMLNYLPFSTPNNFLFLEC
jgi:hypothetical protein